MSVSTLNGIIFNQIKSTKTVQNIIYNAFFYFSTVFVLTKPKALPENMEKLRLENMSLCQRIYSHMKEQEIDMPKTDDCSIIARVKRLHFYSVREEFIVVWKEHEQFLSDYEERVKKSIQLHAKIGNYMTR